MPKIVIPSVVGYPLLRSDIRSFEKASSGRVVGSRALELQESLSLSFPIEGGVIRDWDGMEMLWEETFSQLGKGERALLTESSFNSDRSRQKMLETVFEKHSLDFSYIAMQSVLALYSQGWSTGVVVSSGDGVTDIVPVFDGYALPHASTRVDVAGRDVTRYLAKLLSHRGYSFNRTSDLESIRCAKEKHCYVGLNLDDEKKLAAETVVLEKEFSLPDGRPIRLGPERFEASEAFFSPELIDVETPGVAHQVFSTVQAVDVDLRSTLYQNILLAGGSTLFPGFSTRLARELKGLYLEKVLKGDSSRMDRLKLNIEDPPARIYSVFQGGALLAEIMKDNDEFWISKQEWSEKGAQVLKKLGPR